MKKNLVELAVFLIVTIVSSFVITYVKDIARGFPAYLGFYIGSILLPSLVASLAISSVYYLFRRKNFLKVTLRVMWIISMFCLFIMSMYNPVR